MLRESLKRSTEKEKKINEDLRICRDKLMSANKEKISLMVSYKNVLRKSCSLLNSVNFYFKKKFIYVYKFKVIRVIFFPFFSFSTFRTNLELITS